MNSKKVRVPLRIESDVISREIVIAEPTQTKDRYILRSIPAYAYGIATGDVFEVSDYETGQFSVVERGHQVSVRIFVSGRLGDAKLNEFQRVVRRNGGLFEIGKNAANESETSTLLATFKVSLGLDKIAGIVKGFDFKDSKWEFGNVYDEFGKKEAWLTPPQ
jgi:hypothetical protein